MPDDRLDRLAPLDPALLLRRHRPALASVQQLHLGHHRIDAPVSEIDDDGLRNDADVLKKHLGLLQLFWQRVSVVRVAREGSRSGDQSVSVRERIPDRFMKSLRQGLVASGCEVTSEPDSAFLVGRHPC
jgi:hypothetical protein